MPPAERKQSIQTLFLQRAESYTLCEVARLTGTPARTLRREVARGDHDATKVRGEWRFLWRQAVYVAMERWTLAEIQDALGDAAAGVLPPLLALRAVTFRMPEYVVLALETIAREQRTTIDAFLYGELIDFAGTHLTRLQDAIPGYRQAYLFPGPVVDFETMKPKGPKPSRDVNVNVHRIFGEMIERSEQPPNRPIKLVKPPKKTTPQK